PGATPASGAPAPPCWLGATGMRPRSFWRVPAHCSGSPSSFFCHAEDGIRYRPKWTTKFEPWCDGGYCELERYSSRKRLLKSSRSTSEYPRKFEVLMGS